MSPQHWVKAARATSKFRNEPVQYTGDDTSISLHWGAHSVTISYTAAGVADLAVYDERPKPRTRSGAKPKQCPCPSHHEMWCHQVQHKSTTHLAKDHALKDNIAAIPKSISKMPSKSGKQTKHDMLWYHKRLGHLSFAKMRKMIKAGILPTAST